MTQQQLTFARVLFMGRVQSLQADGYELINQVDLGTTWVAKLIHRNGNRVTLTADPVRNTLRQRTNHRETHEVALH